MDWRTIERVSANGLRREVWTFGLSSLHVSPTIEIRDYETGSRRSRKQEWKRMGFYSRPFPTLPANVRDEVHRRFCEAVTVVDPTETR